MPVDLNISYDQASNKLIAMRFRNGLLNNNVNFEARLYKDENDELISLAAVESTLYKGKNDSSDALFDKYYLIRKRNSKTAKLLPIEEAIFEPELIKQRDVLDSTQMDVNNSALMDLNKTFGSKRTKRITEQYERLKLNVTENVKEELKQTIANVNTDRVASMDHTPTSEVLPVVNESASSPDFVYDLYTLLPKQYFAEINEEAERLINEEEIEGTEYLKNEVGRIKRGGVNIKKSIKIALYIDVLMKFCSTLASKLGNKRAPFCQFSDRLNQFVLESFTVKGMKGRTRPLSCRDKAVCHIIVLALKINNFKIDLEDYSKGLNLGVKKLQEMARSLRCSSIAKMPSLVELKLPLPQPIKIIPKTLGGKKKK